jgi:hypothetical protein
VGRSPKQVLTESAWQTRLNANGWRGITPLIYSHVNLCGSSQLELNSGCPSVRRDSALNSSDLSSRFAMTSRRRDRLPLVTAMLTLVANYLHVY